MSLNTPLGPGELICFGFSEFDCEAKRLASGRHQAHMGEYDEVAVDVRMFRGTYYRFILGPTLTRAEIQELTALKIIEKLRETEDTVRGYAQTVRRNVEAANA